MKKFIFMMTLMMGLVMSVKAQTAIVDNGTVKDNWYVGLGLGTNVWNDATSWTLFNAKSTVNDGVTNSWWRTQPLTVDLTIGKMITPYVGVEADYAAVFNLRGASTFMDSHNLTGNVVVNLSNVIAGYYGKARTIEIEVLGGMGWVHNYGTTDDPNALSIRGAVRGNINLNKKWAITVTPEYLWLPKNVGSATVNKHCVNLLVGAKYRIPSKRGAFPMRKLYNQSEIDSLNARINALQSSNDNLVKANADLAETINRLVAEGNKVMVCTNSVGTVLFEKGKSDVNVNELDSIVKALKETNGSIVLTGTTSPEGGEAVNKPLAIDRANAVKKALVQCGIDASRIAVKNDYDNQRSVVVVVE